MENAIYKLIIDTLTTATKYHLTVKVGVKEVNLTRKVPNLELDKRRVGYFILDNLVCALQKEGFIGGHLVEDHFLDG